MPRSRAVHPRAAATSPSATGTPPAKKRTPFAKRMLQSREAAGLRLDEASVYARDELMSSHGPSRETIRRYEIGDIPEDLADPLVIAALAKVYEVAIKDLSPSIALKLEANRKTIDEGLNEEGEHHRRPNRRRSSHSSWTREPAVA